MEYSKLNSIPSTAEVAFRISRGKFNTYIAGEAKGIANHNQLN